MSNLDMDPKTVIPDAVVLAALNAQEKALPYVFRYSTTEPPAHLREWPPFYVKAMRAALTAAADAINTEDNRPWEPLAEGDPVRVGDEVRREMHGVTITAVVGRVDVDEDGDLWSYEDSFIGFRKYGAWYVRRSARELPTNPGTSIVANDGHKFIEAMKDGDAWYVNEAVLGEDGLWYGAWRRAASQKVIGTIDPELITPDTWRVVSD